MAQTNYDISLTQGDTFTVNFTLKDSVGSPVDLAGATADSYIKLKLSTFTPYAEFVIDNTNFATGVITLSLASSVTEGFPVTKDDESNILFWDLQITFPDLTVKTIVGGTITVLAQVTDLVA
jgi:hypothetical protein